MSVYINQRLWDRNKMQRPIKYSRKGGEECFCTELIDCSESGLSFLSDFPYLPDTRMNVKTSEDYDSFDIKVKWSRPEYKSDDTPCYRIGAEFIETI